MNSLIHTKAGRAATAVNVSRSPNEERNILTREWIQVNPSQQIPVSAQALQGKALEFAEFHVEGIKTSSSRLEMIRRRPDTGYATIRGESASIGQDTVSTDMNLGTSVQSRKRAFLFRAITDRTLAICDTRIIVSVLCRMADDFEEPLLSTRLC